MKPKTSEGYFVPLVIAIVAVISFLALVYLNTPKEQVNEPEFTEQIIDIYGFLKNCSADDDCIMVQNSCTPCSCFRGKRISINKEHEEIWNEILENIIQKELGCEGLCMTALSNDPSCNRNAKAVCIDNSCKITF